MAFRHASPPGAPAYQAASTRRLDGMTVQESLEEMGYADPVINWSGKRSVETLLDFSGTPGHLPLSFWDLTRPGNPSAVAQDLAVGCMHEMKAERGRGARHHFGLRNPILHGHAVSNNNNNRANINDKYFETDKRPIQI